MLHQAQPYACRTTPCFDVKHIRHAAGRPWAGLDYHRAMTRTVGRQARSEFILDPAEALRRGRVLDAMLASASIPRPRGVMRAKHLVLNEMDDQRQLQAARRLNKH